MWRWYWGVPLPMIGGRGREHCWITDLPITAIICPRRWNCHRHAYAAVSAVAVGLAFCAASGAEPRQYLIYCVGNLFMLFGLIFLKKAGRERVRESALMCIVYVLVTFLLAQVGRFCISLIFGADAKMLIQFITTDSLSALFAVIGVLIVRNIDGLFEDQKTYLLRLDAERREQAEDKEEDYRH